MQWETVASHEQMAPPESPLRATCWSVRRDSLDEFGSSAEDSGDFDLAVEFMKIVIPGANEAEIEYVLQGGEPGDCFSFKRVAELARQLELFDYLWSQGYDFGQPLESSLDYEGQRISAGQPPAPSGPSFAPAFGLDGSTVQEDDCSNPQSTTLPELSQPTRQCQCEDTWTSDLPLQTPCTFPMPPRVPFKDPPRVARLVQEVYIGHATRPLLIPIQYSSLPWEHGRVYPLGHASRLDDYTDDGSYRMCAVSDDGSLYNMELAPGPCSAVDEGGVQDPASMNIPDNRSSSSVDTAHHLLPLRPAKSQDPFRCSSGPWMPSRLFWLDRKCPASRRVVKPPFPTAFNMRSFRLPTTPRNATDSSWGSSPFPQSVVLPMSVADGLIAEIGHIPSMSRGDMGRALLSLRPRWLRNAKRRALYGTPWIGRMQRPEDLAFRDSKKDKRAISTLDIPKLRGSSFFDLQHLVSNEDQPKKSQTPSSNDNVDITAPRTMPTTEPVLFDPDSDAVVQDQDLVRLTFKLYHTGSLASDLLRSVDIADDEAAVRIRQMQQEAAGLSLAAQLVTQDLDEQRYVLDTDEGHALYKTMMDGLILTEQTARSISSITSTRRQAFLFPLRKLTRQTTALLADINKWYRNTETSRMPRQLSGLAALAGLEVHGEDEVKAETAPFPMVKAAGSERHVGVEAGRTEAFGTLRQLLSMRDRIRSMHRTLDAAMGQSR